MKPEELSLLKHYFPEAAVAMVGNMYEQRRFKLHFKRPRSSKLGDFRAPRTKNGICTITLNLEVSYPRLLLYDKTKLGEIEGAEPENIGFGQHRLLFLAKPHRFSSSWFLYS